MIDGQIWQNPILDDCQSNYLANLKRNLQLFGTYLPQFVHQSKQYFVVLTQSLFLHPTKEPMVNSYMLYMLLVYNGHSNPKKML